MILKLDNELQVPEFLLWHSCKLPLFPVVLDYCFYSPSSSSCFFQEWCCRCRYLSLLIHIQQITVCFCGRSDSPHPQLWGLQGAKVEHKMGTSWHPSLRIALWRFSLFAIYRGSRTHHLRIFSDSFSVWDESFVSRVISMKWETHCHPWP